MRVIVLARDLITASRLESAAAAAGARFSRIDDPAALPPAADVDLLLVDWGDRGEAWAATLAAWAVDGPATRIVLFGPHTDLAAHAAAREAGMGPMRARSWVFANLPGLLDPTGPAPG
jgi:hypothetical protein